MAKNGIGIQLRLSIIAVAVLLLATGASAAFFGWLKSDEIERRLRVEGASRAELIAASAAHLLADETGESLRALVKATMQAPDIAYVAVFDQDKHLRVESAVRDGFAARGAPGAWPTGRATTYHVSADTGEATRFHELVAPVWVNSARGATDPSARPEGYVRIAVSERSYRQAMSKFWQAAAGIAALTALLGATLFLLLTRGISVSVVNAGIAIRAASKGRNDAFNDAARSIVLPELAVPLERLAAKLRERPEGPTTRTDRLDAAFEQRLATLEQEKADAMRASEAKSQYLATMSHEIRTPLANVIGLTNLVLESPLEARQRSMVEKIRSSGNLLLRVVSNVLDLSKIEAGKLEIAAGEVKLADLAREAIDMFAENARSRGLELHLDVAASVPGTVEGDAVRLSQVIVNLLGNALKYTEAGQVTLSIRRVGGTETRPALQFEVRDTGIGIPPEKLATVFELFEQAGKDRLRDSAGTGLGLAICKRIVALMGGDLAVDSMLGLGSVFRFTLELTVIETPEVAPAPMLAQRRDPQTAHRALASQPATRMQPSAQQGEAESDAAHILIVEDNAINAEVAIGMIEALGLRTSWVENGALAVEHCRTRHYTLVLMDGQMPVMDGLAATRQIRRNEDATKHHQPIVALTAHAFTEFERQCRRAGMDDFLTKPLTKQALLEVLDRWVSDRNAADKSDVMHVADASRPEVTEPTERRPLSVEP